MDERHFFDSLSESWDDNEVLSTPERVNEILDYLDIKQGQKVLDLGTGTGVLLPYIAKRVGPEGLITAVDYSSGMLGRAIKKYSELLPKPTFLNLDFESENIPDEYDRIILYCVYPHLHDPIATLSWLKSVNLKQGGTISIAFPCSADFINRIHEQNHSESGKLVTPARLKELLQENGLNAEVIADAETAYIVNIYK